MPIDCTITYPKDLSKLSLEFNPIDFYEVSMQESHKTTTDLLIQIDLEGGGTILANTTKYIDIFKTYSNPGDLSTSTNYELIGTGFLTDLQEGDVIVGYNGTTKYILKITSVDSDVLAHYQTNIDSLSLPIAAPNLSFNPSFRIRPVVEISATEFVGGSTELVDGNYEVYITVEDSDANSVVNSTPIYKYVYANQYKCVESKLMELALHCSEGCVDMEKLKYTLLLKALLDSLEIAIQETDTTAVSLIKEKIDRYCLLLNNNCTSC